MPKKKNRSTALHLSSFFTDFRRAGRSLAKTPVETVVAVLTLAVCIGAVTTLFSAFDAIWLEPFPFREPDRLVALTLHDAHDRPIGMSYPNFFDLRERAGSFERLSAFNVIDLNLTGTERPAALNGAQVLGNFFELIGFDARLGIEVEFLDRNPGNLKQRQIRRTHGPSKTGFLSQGVVIRLLEHIVRFPFGDHPPFAARLREGVVNMEGDAVTLQCLN